LIVLIAVLSDIHANREAFEACLAAIEGAGADRIVILGDIVGYGADPEWCVEKTCELLAEGTVVIRGNHDQAASQMSRSMTETAQLAIEWTRNQLDVGARAFLGGLPMQVEEDDRLYVHADASAPANWNYVLDADSVRRHLAASSARVSFCGHTHRPALHCLSAASKVTCFTPNASEPIPLSPQRKWLAVMGSVGQPRDGNPAAAFGLYDTETREIRFVRVPYDVETAAGKVRAAGLPASLAERLLKGK
jgi:diadenosine tetraphosphatase ApaH/serine/threonine PP2A family protein phosphatase